MKNICLTTLSSLLLLIAVFFSGSCSTVTLPAFEETRNLMGTYVRIVVYSDEDTANAAIDAAFTRIEEISAIASRFDPASETSLLNLNGSISAPSSEMLDLIRKSIEYYEMSNGYFDITCLPLLTLWGSKVNDTWFYLLDATMQQAMINDTLELVGSDKITVTDNEISFQKAGMKITLDGIAKGYAVDEALKVIKAMGIKHALVDAGGDIGTLGSKSNGNPWMISLVNPKILSQSLAHFPIRDSAIATSGNYLRYFDPDARVGHILNPITGYSATGCQSVTILAANCTKADILATAVFAMGAEQGMNLVESLSGVEALIVDSEGTVHRSSGLLDV